MKDLDYINKSLKEHSSEGSLKKRETCVGGKPHQFVLRTSPYEQSKGEPLDVIEYYANELSESLHYPSWKRNFHEKRGIFLWLVCDKCGKQECEYWLNPDKSIRNQVIHSPTWETVEYMLNSFYAERKAE